MAGRIAAFSIAVGCIVGFAGCGAQHSVRVEGIAFEPTIASCSGAPTHCTSGNEAMLRELREARNHRCPAGKPNVLIKSNGALVCVAVLPSAGPTTVDMPVPSAVQQRGAGAVDSFEAGSAVLASSGCLACHRLGENGNKGPGPDLTHVGSRLTALAIARALVDSRAPMPSFSRLPAAKSHALVYFLSQLR